MPPPDAKEIIDMAATHLRSAELGLGDFRGGDRHSRCLAGLHNAIVWGRAVTFALQKLKSVVGDTAFGAWYGPIQHQLRADADFVYLKNQRNTIEKAGGAVTTSVSMNVQRLDSQIADQLFGPPPPGATSRFLGDPLGGSGWMVRMADGTEEKIYVELPDDGNVSMTVSFHGVDAPTGAVEEVLGRYVEFLRGAVISARHRFAPEPVDPWR